MSTTDDIICQQLLTALPHMLVRSSMPGPSICRPRAKNAAATRQAMLVAARRRFLQESYENVGLRDVAGDAGVDVALVSRYFGSKEELFKEVLRGDGGEKFSLDIAAGELPERLTGLVMDHDSEHDREKIDRLWPRLGL